MQITQVYMNQRIESGKADTVCQPEYLPSLIRRWAEMPIKTYFGANTAELQRLYDLLGLAPHDNPSYELTAFLTMDIPEARELLAVPILAMLRE